MPETERRTPAELILEWREKAQGLRAAADAPLSGGVVVSQPDVVDEWRALEQLYDDCADELEATLRQAEPPTGETPGWRDIASAPRDGTVILGHSHMWAEPKTCFWWARRRTWNRHGGPTFWMPMPPAIPPLPAPSLARPSDAGDPA